MMIVSSCILLLTICCVTSAQESCSQLHELGVTQSGYYQLNNHTTYCDMELDCSGYKGGWTKLVNLDTHQGDSCPQGWNSDQYGGRSYCTGGFNAGCYSVTIPTNDISYARICGWLRGYQKGSMNAFYPTGYALGTAKGYEPDVASSSINGPYVDGVSITAGQPRKHIWTYAVGLSDNYTYTYAKGGYNCPCAKYPGPDPPSFVEDHYYCESGNVGRFTTGRYYISDALWDGEGCGERNKCCEQPRLPWFFRQFNVSVTDDIEVRICRDQSNNDEEVLVEKMAIYIQ